jgi:hypothetical protein
MVQNPDIYIPEYLVEVTKMEDSRRCQHDVKAHITKHLHLYFHSIAQMWRCCRYNHGKPTSFQPQALCCILDTNTVQHPCRQGPFLFIRLSG